MKKFVKNPIEKDNITILEEWTLIDRWWTDNKIEISYKEVNWFGRTLIFKQTLPEKIWRIVRTKD